MNLYAHVASARERLRAAGIPDDEAAIDARLLAQHVQQWDATQYFADGNLPAPPAFAVSFELLVQRRIAREPMAYIVGHQEFWGLDFEVTPDVLIPRPETELVVEAALKWLPDPGAPARLADICTGSGCIAVAVARERPRVRVIATDISPAALQVAERNASHHGVSERVSCVVADLLTGLPGRLDMIVSNPPYVPDGDREGLQPEVRDFEPRLALFAGALGLDAIERLLEQAADRLVPGGLLIFEFGIGQSADIARLISRTTRLTMDSILDDLQGIPRVAIVRGQ